MDLEFVAYHVSINFTDFHFISRDRVLLADIENTV